MKGLGSNRASFYNVFQNKKCSDVLSLVDKGFPDVSPSFSMSSDIREASRASPSITGQIGWAEPAMVKPACVILFLNLNGQYRKILQSRLQRDSGVSVRQSHHILSFHVRANLNRNISSYRVSVTMKREKVTCVFGLIDSHTRDTAETSPVCEVLIRSTEAKNQL